MDEDANAVVAAAAPVVPARRAEDDDTRRTGETIVERVHRERLEIRELILDTYPDRTGVMTPISLAYAMDAGGSMDGTRPRYTKYLHSTCKYLRMGIRTKCLICRQAFQGSIKWKFLYCWAAALVLQSLPP